MCAATSTINSSMSSNRSTKSKRAIDQFSYFTCDRILMMVQRLLFCALIFVGYDLTLTHLQECSSYPRLIRTYIRIIRNFFLIIKAIRKWLSINYNDGIIPPPAVPSEHRKIYSGNLRRSTPKDPERHNPNLSGNGDGRPDHSPIEHCYTEPPKTYGFVEALQNRNQSDLQNPDIYESSDLTKSSSLSFKFMIQSFYEGVTGVINDPDEKHQHKFNNSENIGRMNMVSESVLEYCESIARKLKESAKKEGRVFTPLPIPNFDETSISGGKRSRKRSA